MDNILATLNWDDLRVFLAVARSGSVRGAARQIGKTHATVSRHVRSLQAALANPVFERRREGQCLTDLGTRILPLALQVESSIKAIDRTAFSADTGLAGPVKLSLPESLYLSLLYKPIDGFMQHYPMIDLNITTTDNLVKLAWREADVVVRITNTPPEAAYGRKLAESPLAVYASNEYLETRPKRDRWIAFDYEPARTPVIPARVVAHADTPALAIQMIKLGRGIGMLPCYMGDTEPNLKRIDGVDVIPDMQIWVLTHNDIRKNPRIRALMDHLYKAFDLFRPVIEGKRPALMPKSKPPAN